MEDEKTVIATPASIKREFPIYPKAPAHLKWPSKAVKGLVYMVTDKGLQQKWLREIGKSEEPWCVCDGWTPQNTAHLLEDRRCPQRRKFVHVNQHPPHYQPRKSVTIFCEHICGLWCKHVLMR